MKESLSTKLLKRVRSHYPSWVNGGELERYAMELGKKGSTASRVLRDLSEDEECPLEKKVEKSVYYRAKKPRQVLYSSVPDLKKTIIRVNW